MHLTNQSNSNIHVHQTKNAATLTYNGYEHNCKIFKNISNYLELIPAKHKGTTDEQYAFKQYSTFTDWLISKPLIFISIVQQRKSN